MNTLHRKIHKHLKLQHHKHTGKVLHHEHTSYRGLAVVLVFTAAAMAGVNLIGRAAADSLFVVQGTEPVAVPTSPAIITTPVNGAKIAGTSTLITGSCPLVTPQVVVTVTVDGTSAGSAACDSSNDFSLPISLGSGSHTLLTQIYTIAAQTGPQGSPLQIAAGSLVPKLGTSETTANPIIITSTTPFSYLGADKTAVWNGSITGGTAPYHVHIDWNDGSQSTNTVSGDAQHFSHTYATLQSYDPLLSVTDSAGHAVSQQFAVAAYTTATLGSSLVATTNPGPQGPIATTTLLGFYGLLLTVASVAGIIWLEAKHSARQQTTLA